MLSFDADGIRAAKRPVSEPPTRNHKRIRSIQTPEEHDGAVQIKTEPELADDIVNIVAAEVDTVKPFGSETLESAQISLLESGQYADLNIDCNGEVWKAHRCVLVPHCSLFAVSATRAQGQRRGVINLDGHDPAAVLNMLKYLYSQNIGPQTGLPIKDKVSQSFAIMVLADQYLLPGLARLALNVLKFCIEDPEGDALHQIVPAMYNDGATPSLVDSRDEVIDMAAKLLSTTTSFKLVMQKLSIMYGKFTFAAAYRMEQPVAGAEDDESEDSEEEDEKLKKRSRPLTRTQKAGKAAASQAKTGAKTKKAAPKTKSVF